MDLTRLQKLARKLDELDSAWSRFDSVQAEREAEIRRPAKHIDVMSDKEYDRIKEAEGYVKEVFDELIHTRKMQLETTMDLVYRFFAGDDNKELDKGIKHIADCVSGTLVLRCQARSNPFFKDPPPGRARPKANHEGSAEAKELSKEDLEKLAKELNMAPEDVQNFASTGLGGDRIDDDSDLMIKLNTQTHPGASSSRAASLLEFAMRIPIFHYQVPDSLDVITTEIIAEQVINTLHTLYIYIY